MKSALLLLIFPLFMIGVIGANDVVSVSLKEGDLVTLHTDVTAIQTDDVIDWRFNGLLIARINSESSEISVLVKPNTPFTDRVQLDKQTGDLSITSFRTTDTGQYILKITSTESSSKIFNISVVSADAVESLSVMKGDSVTLLADHTDIQRNMIRWMFEYQNPPVAEINSMAGIFNTSDGPDGRFRDRLQLNKETGSLTIKNIGTNHSGLYEAEISSTRASYTRQHTQSFNLTVSDGPKSVSVNEGDSVTLHTDTKIHDLTEWMFANIRLAEIDKALQRHHIYPGGRFRDRLKLNNQTGSLTITNIRTTDSGDYELKISSSRRTINRRFTVIVTAVSGSGLGTGIGVGAGVLLVTAVCYYFRKQILSAVDDYCPCCKKSEQVSDRGVGYKAETQTLNGTQDSNDPAN